MPIAASRGDLEGALGGQWIPDTALATPAIATPLSASWAAPHAAPLAAQWAAPWTGAPWAGAPWAARSIAAPAIPALGWGASRGALEGALGGQWIPDVLPGH